MQRIAIAAAIIGFWANPVFGGHISLNTTVSATVAGNLLRISVLVQNSGNEKAFRLQAKAEAAESSGSGQQIGELPTGGTYRADMTFLLGLETPGTYPLLVWIHYTDANGHPFSVISCQTFSYRRQPAPLLTGSIKPVAINRKGSVEVLIKNQGSRHLDANVRLALPQELESKDSVQTLAVSPGVEKPAGFSIRNRSSFAGSTYQIFALIVSESEGLHHTFVAQGSVTVSEENFFREYKSPLLITALLLFLLFLALQIKRPDRRPS